MKKVSYLSARYRSEMMLRCSSSLDAPVNVLTRRRFLCDCDCDVGGCAAWGAAPSAEVAAMSSW